MTTQSDIRWDDLPPRPWPENTEPTADDLADYLTSLGHEHLVWMLGQQRSTWRQESDCFLRNHAGRIRDYEQQLDAVHNDLVSVLAALGIGDHARPYSSHEVVVREVLPAIERLLAASSLRGDDHA